MARIYLSALAFIREREFDVFVPAFYHPNLPKSIYDHKPQPLEKRNPYKMVPTKRKSPLPFRHVIDPNQMQKAAYSTEVLIDMFIKKIEHEIANEDDVPLIFDGLDRYLMTLKNDIEMGVENITAYARIVVKYREVIYHHYYRYMQTHPATKELLYPNNDSKKNLLSLMSMSSGARADVSNLDPLRAKAFPPYDIDAIKPKGADTVVSGESDIESSLGLSSAGGMTDDSSGFDFDNFLKG